MQQNLLAFAPDEYLNGKLLLIDKPIGWTSFQVVGHIRNQLSRYIGIKKIKVGHAGTLDPLATGLLLICTGKLTRDIEDFMGLNKCYSGQIKLGFTTLSYDAETPEIKGGSYEGLTFSEITNKSSEFNGDILQIPPNYSAVKQAGKRLYELARNGQENDIQKVPRRVKIDSFIIKEYINGEASFSVCCSKGTYIRSLAHDFGQALSCGGYLTALRRESIGGYFVRDAITPKEWSQS